MKNYFFIPSVPSGGLKKIKKLKMGKPYKRKSGHAFNRRNKDEIKFLI